MTSSPRHIHSDGPAWRHREALYSPVDVKKPQHKQRGLFGINSGDVLLSHTLARAVPSGLKSLTSVFGMGTGGTSSLRSPKSRFDLFGNIDGQLCVAALKQSQPTVNFMVKPNGLLVTVSSTHYCAYTSVLSTWSSSTALLSLRLGNLILGKVSRLYAFSAYPNRTSLPSYATGVTTGSQEVRSSRSSRTKDKPPQISCAHSR